MSVVIEASAIQQLYSACALMEAPESRLLQLGAVARLGCLAVLGTLVNTTTTSVSYSYN